MTMLVPILAGIGALCMSNPRRRRKARRAKKRNPSTAWNVYLGGKLIDTVFYSTNEDPDSVKRSLVNHDGYDSRIEVRKARYHGHRKQNPPYHAHVGPVYMRNPRGATRITKKEWYADGAWANSKLFRIQKRGAWHYYRSNPPYHAHVGPVYMRNGGSRLAPWVVRTTEVWGFKNGQQDTRRGESIYSGKASASGLAAWVRSFNKSMQPGGVNAHMRGLDGSIPWVYHAVLRNQKTGKSYTYDAPAFEVMDTNPRRRRRRKSRR